MQQRMIIEMGLWGLTFEFQNYCLLGPSFFIFVFGLNLT